MTAILIDAGSYLHRAFFSRPPMQRSDGLPTGCLHGFAEMLWRLRKREANCTHIAVCFDSGRSAHRAAIYPDYKANRKPLPDDLRTQMPLARDVARAFGIAVIEVENTEADDLLASYATAFDAAEHDVMIVSGDKDLMQMIGARVSLYDPVKAQIVGVGDVIAKLGVMPQRAIDAQALIGDAADNVPGAPGIGVKTAGALLAEFGSLDNLLASVDRVKNAKTRETLIAFRDQILMSRELVTLKRDVPLPLPLNKIEARYVDAEALVEFAQSMEFASFGDDVTKFYRIGAYA